MFILYLFMVYNVIRSWCGPSDRKPQEVVSQTRGELTILNHPAMY
jgi:hypothetical protein